MKVLKNELLKKHTSFHAGGPAMCYAVPEDREELIALIRFLYKEKLPYRIIGNGTNLLVSDQGLNEVIVEVGRMMEGTELLPGDRIRVTAGTLLSRAALFAYEHGLAGMEALRGIPGTVGGGVTMNAGAYGTEICDVLESCEVIDPDGTVRELPAAALRLSYRYSAVPESGWIVLSAVFRLKKDDPEQILARMRDYQQRRMDKQPLNKFSAGSTFACPEGCFAGRLIEEAGLRGFSLGTDAKVSEKHCGFVINDGNASAEDIYRLIREIQARVYRNAGIRLEPEVKIWGNF